MQMASAAPTNKHQSRILLNKPLDFEVANAIAPLSDGTRQG